MPARSRGMAALTVVMVLFFVMALGAAYANRTLILEQRVSLLAYRAARATQASEASLNWMLAMLNGGNVNAQCQPSVNPADNDFRVYQHGEVLAEIAVEGGYDFWERQARRPYYMPGCIIANAQITCSCSINDAPKQPIPQPADGIGSAFHALGFPPTNSYIVAPGVFGIYASACGSLGSGLNDCSNMAIFADLPQVDGVDIVALTTGLLRALPVAPVAALTAGGDVNASAGTLIVANPDTSSGFTVISGGTYTNGTNDNFVGPAGSSSDTKRHSVIPLRDLANLANDGWFKTVFAMQRSDYSIQPAARVLNCAAGCDQSQLAPVLAGYPRNPIVIEGNLTISDASTIGSTANPAMLMINGSFTLSGNATIKGFVHANSVNWTATNATLSGAMLTPGSVSISGIARIMFDRGLIDTVRLRYGSLLPASGSYNFRDGGFT